MWLMVAVGAVLLILFVLLDAFETIVVPRRASRRATLTRLVYRASWMPWSALARRMGEGRWRENVLGWYGPFALLLLVAVWVAALIVLFGALQWSFNRSPTRPDDGLGFPAAVYLSGSTFFTLGLGDVVPSTALGKAATVVEAGMGFGFLALVIAYLPVLYQSFSRREVSISLLDARAGSPPTAYELLRRHSQDQQMDALGVLLHDWERWSAELLESHLSYPSLAYFRSQHEHQSWLAALTAILDTTALVMVGMEGVPAWRAQLTFAIARHAAVDLAQVFGTPPRPADADRLPPAPLSYLREMLSSAGLELRSGDAADQRLFDLRQTYEPYVQALSHRLLLPLPPWIPPSEALDAWQTSAWEGTRIGSEDDR